MKELTLVRHAKSSWKDRDLADFDRPLNARGKSDAPLMGRRLAARGRRPDLVLSSPAKRALATLKKIAQEVGFSERDIVTDSRAYEAGAHELLSLVRGIDDAHHDVLLCGHNPGLTDFSNLITNRIIDNIPTCGVVSIRFPFDSWREVRPGSGEVLYFDYPKRAMGSDP
ncbi:MAG: histidine phosphatase family protein [Deltaproteobacteria bacterium]|nr:histidine phosphatase family protein [Deltaproteobacteria bacterium]